MALIDTAKNDVTNVFLTDFSEAITYNPDGSPPKSIKALVEYDDNLELTLYDDGQAVEELCTIHVSTADVPSPSRDDTFDIGSYTYRVYSRPSYDSFGVLSLRLARYAFAEKSARDHRIVR